MIHIGIGELEVAIDLEEPGDRKAFVETLIEHFNASAYVLSDIATAEEGRVIDLYVEAFISGSYIDIQRFVDWLEGTVSGITEQEEDIDETG